MYPWRSFVASHGLFPLKLWVIPAIEYSMQVQLDVSSFIYFILVSSESPKILLQFFSDFLGNVFSILTYLFTILHFIFWLHFNC